MAELIAYGGAERATGANFLLRIGGEEVLVDCGMEQGANGAHAHNVRPFPYDPKRVRHLFITHAHIDHVGLIPKLVKEGFAGEIFSTEETRAIAELLLEDAARIGTSNGDPLYGPEDIARTMSLWKTLPYHEKRDFSSFTLEAFDAGHVLGSAMYRFSTGKGTFLATGDIGNSPSPLLRDHERVGGLDYLLMESVYGDRNHEDRSERKEKFKQVVLRAVTRGGTLLIPAFSLERTQEILLLLNELFEAKALPPVPVYLDSPLAIRITEVYERVKDLYNGSAERELERGGDLFKFPKLVETARVEDSKEIAHVSGPKIVIAGSGMSTAGRILHHEELFLPDPNSTILIMGYQAAGTMGRQIEEGVKKIFIKHRSGTVPVDVRAKVEKIDGFSGHADSDALVKFVEPSAKTLKKVFVAMAEPASQAFLAQRLHDEFGLEAVSIEEGKTYELDM